MRYSNKQKDWQTEEGLAKIEEFVASSSSRQEIADKIGIGVSTLGYWAASNENIDKVLGDFGSGFEDEVGSFEQKTKRSLPAKCMNCSARRGSRPCHFPEGLCEVYKHDKQNLD